jgi:hypothetical protein
MYKTRNKNNFFVQDIKAPMKSKNGWSIVMKPVAWAWSVDG